MQGAGGYAPWILWAVIAIGTAAFWFVTFLTLRGLFEAPHADEPSDVETGPDPDTLERRLDRGAISVEEYVHHRSKGGDGP